MMPRTEAAPLPARHRLVWLLPVVAAFVLAVVVSGLIIRREFEQQRAQAGARLESLVELRAVAVQTWVERQTNLARFLKDSVVFADLYARWQTEGDVKAGEMLLNRFAEFRRANDADSALIVDADGVVLAHEHPANRPQSRELVEAVREAIAHSDVRHTSIYRRSESPMPLRMDVVIPLLKTGTPARAAIVLRVDPRRSLFPLISAWPTPTRTAESSLWERAGDRVVNMGDVQGPPDRIEQPLADSTLPIARVIRGEFPRDGAARAVRDAGKELLFAARPVRGTGWWMVAKIDLDEVDEPAWRSARWVLFAAVLVVLGTALASRLVFQRRLLAQGQRERAESRERLQTLGLLETIAQSASDSIFAKDLEGRYVFCNRAAAATLGLLPSQMVGRTDVELFGEAAAAELVANDRLVVAQRQSRVVEEMLPTRNGTMVGLATKGPLFDTDGEVIGMLGVSRDLTETRRAERALRDSEAHYRSVVSALSEGVVVCDPQGNVLSCNPAAERLIGARSADWQGQKVLAPGWTLTRADGSPMAPGETPTGQVLMGAPAQHDVLVSAISPAGTTEVFETSAVPVISPDTGEMLAVVTSFGNVTKRQQLDAELQRHRRALEERVAERTLELKRANDSLESAARFNRAITDAIPGRVAYWDHELRCRFANRAYADGIATTTEQMLGRTVAEIYGDEHVGQVQPGLEAEMLGEGRSFIRERLHPDRIDQVQQVEYIPERRADGRVAGVYVMAFDITALKRAEQQLQLANEALVLSRDQAETANRAKSAFLANMSHEIRTPMNAIIGLTHLMSRDLRDELQRARLHKVGDAAQHLLQVINDILDLSKIEAGKLQLDDTEFAIDTVLSRVIEMVDTRAKDKGLELILDPDHLPARLRGDPTRLSQILINMLSNAVKFTEHGWVRLSGELLSEQGDRLQVRFEVQDTGPGISTERQASLFTAFEQADSSLSRPHGGTGLGLALSRQLAISMGGEAGVTSAPGAGSTFWFTAWLGKGSAAREPAPRVSAKDLRALVVDDVHEAKTVIAERLQVLGLAVDAVDSGAAALREVEVRMAAREPYDVMLIDWRMAPLDGLETQRRLRALLGEGMPPSILVTAVDDPTLAQQAREAGYSAVMHKPVTTSALQDALATVLNTSATALPSITADGSEVEGLLRIRHAGQRVLLAEDNPVNREVAQELLRSAGLVVEVAIDGAQAVEMALSRRYDIVMMDVQMPRLDGLEASRAIRAKAGRAMPIIAMTANAFLEDRQACLNAGMDDHVAKPVNPTLLYATLLRWMPLRDAAQAAPGAAAAPSAQLVAAPEPQPLCDRLAAIEAFDTATALRNVGGQVPVLRRVLKRFVDTYGDGLPALLDVGGGRDGAAGESLPKWRTACHSIRGALATIGATGLLHQVTALERAIAETGSPHALAPAGRQVHESLLALVARLASELDARG